MRLDTLTSLSRNSKAAVLITAFVLLYSLAPAVVALSDTRSPFLFGFTWNVGLLVSLVVFIAVRFSDLLRSQTVWRLIWQHSFNIAMMLWIASRLQIALFAWSASVVDVAITAVLYETWPLGIVLLTARLSGRWHVCRGRAGAARSRRWSTRGSAV